MNRIDKIFSKIDHTALIGYVTAGYPDIETSLKIIPLLAKNGCDIIEIGIPFSDPLADGVTIQNASYHALQSGVTTKTCLELVSELRKTVDIPLIFMTYFNPVYRYGIDTFCKACVNVGIDGLIIPDMPPEEGFEVEKSSQSYGLDIVYLLAPTSNEARIRAAAEHSQGFVYLVSVTGITGARTVLPSDLASFIGKVRTLTDKPLCVGFGISTPEQAGQIGKIADGVIIGSRIIQLIESDTSLRQAIGFISGVRKALVSKD